MKINPNVMLRVAGIHSHTHTLRNFTNCSPRYAKSCF